MAVQESQNPMSRLVYAWNEWEKFAPLSSISQCTVKAA